MSPPPSYQLPEICIAKYTHMWERLFSAIILTCPNYVSLVGRDVLYVGLIEFKKKGGVALLTVVFPVPWWLKLYLLSAV